MNYLKKLIMLYEKKKNPINYARKLGVSIGQDCRFISCPSFGSEPWLITIGNHVEITSEVKFVTHDGSTWVFRDHEPYRKVIRFGKITIDDNTFIGTRSMILPGVHIGKNCIVGAGSLVTKSIPDGEVWGGNPARFITKTSEFADKCLRETPPYDFDQLNKNRKEEILRILK